MPIAAVKSGLNLSLWKVQPPAYQGVDSLLRICRMSVTLLSSTGSTIIATVRRSRLAWASGACAMGLVRPDPDEKIQEEIR